ncbi:hypothetical protein GKIL_0039 [Gloeobacter kilaueensis JS1]|uniref:Uncharacterized protein n=1 Tax=Gloeobacter kilaueensis (strain ATCC BAA-2537 / CCAP 1431/1 / ULC 316 / JS1) TaxID=1183438 RepID=U5QBQ0_GLOK1|nr:hypothetical protein GKIL_0039 [Gloeobacter kilaueensis JS1]
MKSISPKTGRNISLVTAVTMSRMLLPISTMSRNIQLAMMAYSSPMLQRLITLEAAL